jgi:hypothetical protein
MGTEDVILAVYVRQCGDTVCSVHIVPSEPNCGSAEHINQSPLIGTVSRDFLLQVF